MEMQTTDKGNFFNAEGYMGAENEDMREFLRYISVLREMNVPAQTILLQIQKQFNLNPETSKKYL